MDLLLTIRFNYGIEEYRLFQNGSGNLATFVVELWCNEPNDSESGGGWTKCEDKTTEHDAFSEAWEWLRKAIGPNMG